MKFLLKLLKAAELQCPKNYAVATVTREIERKIRTGEWENIKTKRG